MGNFLIGLALGAALAALAWLVGRQEGPRGPRARARYVGWARFVRETDGRREWRQVTDPHPREAAVRNTLAGCRWEDEDGGRVVLPEGETPA